jgi:hypothetical protein
VVGCFDLIDFEAYSKKKKRGVQKVKRKGEN